MIKAVLFSFLLFLFYLPQNGLAQNGTTSPPINPNTTVVPTGSGLSGCSSRLDCSSCSKEWFCIWCENGNQSACVDGTPWGSSKSTCGSYRWALCSFTGKFLLIVACVILGIFVLLIFVCVCCCCCRKRRKEPQYHQMESIINPSDDAYISKHPKTCLLYTSPSPRDS
eukprot:TRINITY_DN7156_c0_g2_i1.p1 TRINITY_DN7156_c0_g2~~TRINITY_DN7156_c0_g2_i1.p1  ORF type:complete len:168 (-),score=12.97 TRINITY_DN7156_c0_g2_i1:1-504(-)